MWCLFDMMFDAYALRMLMIKILIVFNIWDVTLGVAQEVPIYGRTLEILYYPWFSSEELKFTFVVAWERQKGERDSDLRGHLNNKDVDKP
jgi:hypothetical protein